MIDPIERQDAIDALTRKMVSIPTAGEKDLMGDVNRIRTEDISVIRRLPSAQPETHEKRTGTHACDLISRQAALDCFHDWIDKYGDVHTPDEMQEYNAIEALPSAQPEIVRCKDCKHSRFFDPCFYCYEFGEEINVPENGFCFIAKRRTDA